MDWSLLPLSGEGGLIDALRKIPDPRGRRGRRYSATSLLASSICGVLAGAKSIQGIADWVQQLDREQRRRLGLRRHRPPSESAIRKFLGKLDAGVVDGEISRWTLTRTSVSQKAIAIDGKSLRGTAEAGHVSCHLLSAVLHAEGLTIAQRRIDDKTNEIKTIRPLLDQLDIAGAVVTFDALHTQRDTARYLVEDKKADYLMTVKRNQASLFEAIEAAGMTSFFSLRTKQ